MDRGRLLSALPALSHLVSNHRVLFPLQGSYLAHTQGKKHQTNL